MKLLIKAAQSYKDNDSRLPLIKAVENILGLKFEGSKSTIQWSENYQCYMKYDITSKQDTYRLKMYQSSDDNPEHFKFINTNILEDVTDYIKENFSQYFIKIEKRYGTIVCKPYFEDVSKSDSARKLASKIGYLVVKFDDEFKKLYHGTGGVPQFSSYKTYEDCVKITWTWHTKDRELLETAREFIVNAIEDAGYDVKSSSASTASPTYYGGPYLPEQISVYVYTDTIQN